MDQKKFLNAIYFYKSQKLALKFKPKRHKVTMQFYQRHNNVVVSGLKHALDVVKKKVPNYKELDIWALHDGDLVQSKEPVLIITGYYEDYCFLEGEIDGILGAESTIATNARHLIKVASAQQIIYMNDRNGFLGDQGFEGYAAYKGGVRNFTAHAQTQLINDDKVKIFGSMPHSLIQLYQGNLNKVLTDYHSLFPGDKLVGLVDYNNNVVKTSLAAAQQHPDLYAVRVDTSPALVDKSLQNSKSLSPNINANGVSPILIQKLRTELDKAGFHHIKIIVSSDITPHKIANFNKQNVKVDYYGVGLYFKSNYINFTGNSVLLDGRPEAKSGVKLEDITKLKQIKW